MAQPKPQWPHQPAPGVLLREAACAPHHRRQWLPAAYLFAPEHRRMDGTARGARAAAPPRRRAAAPPRRLSCHLSRRLSSRVRACTAPCARQTRSPSLSHITPLPPGCTSPLPHSLLPPAFAAGVGQRPLRLIKRGARWCAARQLPRKRRRQQIVWQGADTRGLRPLGRRRPGHDGRELRHAQWPRDQLAGRGGMLRKSASWLRQS